MKLDLLTNATVVSDAVKFVNEHNNKKAPVEVSLTEQKSEGLTTATEEEITATTRNHVF